MRPRYLNPSSPAPRPESLATPTPEAIRYLTDAAAFGAWQFWRICGQSPDLLDDLTAAARFGLAYAIDTWDGRAAFNTWAVTCFRTKMQDYLREIDHLPRSMREAARAERAAAIAAGIEWIPPAKYAPPTSFEAYRFNNDEDADSMECVGNGLVDPEHPDDLVPHAMELQEIVSELDALPERERFVIRANLWDGLTFKAIGRTLEVSESRAYQLYHQGIRRLRQRLSHLAHAYA